MNPPTPFLPIRWKDVPLFIWDSYASWWIIHKVELRRMLNARASIKICTGHTYVCVYVIECWIVALRGWYLYFRRDTPETTFGETGKEALSNLLDSITIHGPWHSLLLSILVGLTCMKLVRMWTPLVIPCATQMFTALKIALMHMNQGCVGSRTK